MQRPAEPITRFCRRLAMLSVIGILVGTGATAQKAKLDPSQYPSREISVDATTIETLRVPIDQSHVFRTDVQVQRLVVGNPEVADVVMMSPNSFYVLGKELGRTNLQVYSGGDFPSAMMEIEVSADLKDLRRTLQSAVPSAKIEPRSVNGHLRLEGTVPDAVALDRVLEIAAQYSSEDVINAIRITSPQQVFLEVRIVEASRNAAVDLGVELNAAHADGPRFESESAAGAVSFGSFATSFIEHSVRIDAVIDALERRGLVRSLAEPTLTALSGETASFLAGGEVPIPRAGQDGEVTVEYKEFGVRLIFTPTVLSNGLINLELMPEVSQVTFAGDFPSFTTRRANTTVELTDGQSFAIAGLLQRSSSRRLRQLPWLGDVPLLGALFRSAAFQEDETDLVIIVTPHLSRPANASEPLATPLDFTAPTNKAELFLTGKQEVSRDNMARRIRERGISGPFGHIVDFQEPEIAK